MTSPTPASPSGWTQSTKACAYFDGIVPADYDRMIDVAIDMDAACPSPTDPRETP